MEIVQDAFHFVYSLGANVLAVKAGLVRYGKRRFYRFYLKFGVQKSSKSAINKKWQIALNLINFHDISNR
jgi:hypothetical protein